MIKIKYSSIVHNFKILQKKVCILYIPRSSTEAINDPIPASFLATILGFCFKRNSSGISTWLISDILEITWFAMSIFPTVQAHLTLSGNFIRYNKTRKNGIPIASCKKFSFFFFLSFSFLGGVKREKKQCQKMESNVLF